MRLSISTRRGWILSVVALAAIALATAPAAFAQDPPEIIIQPDDAVACNGYAATFTVVAIGDPPLEYQWYQDGVAIFEANEASCTIDPVGPDAAGDYTVVVSNAFGWVESDPATLTVVDGTPPTIIEQPQDAEVCDGEAATFTVIAEGAEPLSYQWRRNGASIFGANESSYTIDPVGPDAAAEFSVVVSNVCGWIESDVVTLTVHEGPDITQQPQGQTPCEGESVTLSVTASGFGTIDYQWRKDGADIPGATSETYTIDPVSTGDAGDYDVVVSDDCDQVVSDPATLIVDSAPSITQQPAGQQVCEDDPVTFSVVAAGMPAPSYQWRKDGVDIPGATSDIYTIDSVSIEDGGDYDVVVANVCGEVTSDPATLTVDTAPAITQQPVNQEVCPGDPVTFSVVATGTPLPSYQWRKDGADISGATSETYIIDSVGTEDGGDYDVVITNDCDEVISEPAALTVDAAPSIAQQPVSQEVCEGDLVTLSVSATGTPPPSYQWRKDGVDIPGATSETYTIGSVGAGDGGDYDVVVANLCGEVVSDPATL
ncbi:MAG: immunoglobulin domain-containing protein, partial [Planctomycetes bacterium]|nr:immunoglobulin domain-containing protein [Planctomycetota bacterium]